MSMLISTTNSGVNNGRIHVTKGEWEEPQLNTNEVLNDTLFNSMGNKMLRILGTRDIQITTAMPSYYYNEISTVSPRPSYYLVDIGDWLTFNGINMEYNIVIATLFNVNLSTPKLINITDAYTLFMDIGAGKSLYVTDYDLGLANDKAQYADPTIRRSNYKYLAFRAADTEAMDWYNNRQYLTLTIKYFELEARNGSIIDLNQYSANHDIEIGNKNITLNGLDMSKWEHLIATSYPNVSQGGLYITNDSIPSGTRPDYPDSSYLRLNNFTSFITNKNAIRCGIAGNLSDLTIYKDGCYKYVNYFPNTRSILFGSYLSTHNSVPQYFHSHYTTSGALTTIPSGSVSFTIDTSTKKSILIVIVNSNQVEASYNSGVPHVIFSDSPNGDRYPYYMINGGTMPFSAYIKFNKTGGVFTFTQLNINTPFNIRYYVY